MKTTIKTKTMKSIIQNVKQTDFSTIIKTKSGITKIYNFKTEKENNEFYNSII